MQFAHYRVIANGPPSCKPRGFRKSSVITHIICICLIVQGDRSQVRSRKRNAVAPDESTPVINLGGGAAAGTVRLISSLFTTCLQMQEQQ